MKQSSIFLTRSMAASLLLMAGLLLTGCEHLYYADPYATSPGLNTGFDFNKPTPTPVAVPVQSDTLPPVGTQPTVAAPVQPPAVAPPSPASDALLNREPPGATVIQVGDLLTVTFSDLPAPGLPEFKGRVGEDGNITLPLNITIKAAGKTPGQLQQEIRAAYVPRYYVNLTITVKTEDRFFFVGGEVRNPQRLPYFAQITVLRAIQAAGDFTDFANRKKVQLIRSNGQKHIINCLDAQKKPALDLQVFPNDTINVPRKGF